MKTKKDRKIIYLDSASTTSVYPKVVDKMLPFLSDNYGNPNSLHKLGRIADEAVNNARINVADLIGAHSSEIYFTSCGSEANSWALKGIAYASEKRRHIIVSSIEHDSILESCKALEEEGFKITYLSCDKNGMVDIEELKRVITRDTMLVSVMMVNNELGTIQNIKRIADIAHSKGAFCHTDIVQALGHLSINVEELGIDLASMSAHKIHGPKGVGALYVKTNIPIANLIEGGSQERGKRGGTLNVPGIVGFGEAAFITKKNLNKFYYQTKIVSNYFFLKLLEKIKEAKINCAEDTIKVPNIVSVSFTGVNGESLMAFLDNEGIEVSKGSACNSDSSNPSHVLKAIGMSDKQISETIRFSFDETTSIKDIDYVIQILKRIVETLKNV